MSCPRFRPVAMSLRRALLVLGATAIASGGHGLQAQVATDSVLVVESPPAGPADGSNDFYVNMRPPLRPTPLIKLPVGAIRPGGWLRKQLELQAAGFHGHLGEISRFLKKEGNAWLSPTGEGSHGWEEPPYWLKGYLNLAYLLEDEAMIAEAKIWVEGALRSQKPDGWFGPDGKRSGLATRLQGREDLWPNMIMLFCLQDYHEATSDERVLELMTRYFDYLEGVPEDRFLVGYWPRMRGGDLLWSIYWLYNRTGETSLLELADKVHRRTADWSSGVINWHNVNMSQGFGQPTTRFLQSKEPRHLEASYSNYDEIRRTYGQVPGGMFGGDENCRPGYDGPRQAVETCGMVEMMLSLETLTWITGDLVWADRCEDVAFNSLPAALTADLKALRYLTAPNMPLSDSRSKSPGIQNSGPMYHMNPHDHRCCQHNWGHGWPYFAEHLWFATSDDGLAAVFPCASAVTARVGTGEEVTIETASRYPFEETVELTVETPRAVRFPLYLRVPGWCDAASVTVSGKKLNLQPEPLQYVKIERQWRDGDTVQLMLPMRIELRRWEENFNSVSVDRGPLTYSLRIGEQYVRKGGTDEWPAWEIHPTTPWNYGLVLEEVDPAGSFRAKLRGWPDSDMPFTLDGTPIVLEARAKRIPEWKLDERGLVREIQRSPVVSEEPTEAVTLVPMGAARLRISSFPVIGEGEDAHRWEPPPEPAFDVVASHCFEGDTPTAIADGFEPQSSGDHSIPRFTWWDHRGSEEWIEARFREVKRISEVDVYWFDDTGRGACRVPLSWKLSYREGDDWKAVEDASGLGVARDRWNTTTFSPIETTALRLDVKLQDGYSGGILELRVR